VGDERLAGPGEVPEAQVEGVDPKLACGLVHVRLDGPDLLGIAEAAERRRRHGVGEHAPGEDADVRHAVGAVRGVATLRYRPIGDVGVRADQVVRFDVAEHERPVPREPGPDADLRGSSPDGLERLLEAEHEANTPARRPGHERQQRLVLRVLLAAERPARIRGVDPDLRQRQPEQVRDDALEPIGMLDCAPDRDSIAVGRGHERVGLDRELGDHREGVRALDDDIRLRRRGVDVAPAVTVLVKDVRCRARVAGPERRVLDERRVGVERGPESMERGKLREGDLDEASRFLRGVERLGGDRCHGLALVLRLADGEDGSIAPLWPEPRNRLGQVGRRHDEPDTGDRQRRRRVDRVDPRPGDVDGDELHMERVGVGQVGDVLLLPGDAGTAADPGGGLPDAHCGATFASGTAERSPTAGAVAAASLRAPAAAASTASMICS
jgi:hypothetical protein